MPTTFPVESLNVIKWRYAEVPYGKKVYKFVLSLLSAISAMPVTQLGEEDHSIWFDQSAVELPNVTL